MKLITVLMLVLVASGRADWSKETLKDFKSLQGLVNLKHQDVLTLWGGVKRYLNAKSLEGEEFSVQLPSFKKELKLYAYRKDSKTKAPLVVFFPGIFGSHQGQVSPWILNIFEKNSFHTAVVPNFLNKNYIKAVPRYTKENALSLDARAALLAVEKIIEKIGPENISHVSFLGESLGTFVAASSVQFAAEFPNTFKLVKNVILLWPSLNLKRSLEAFDEKASEYRATYENCSYVLKAFSFFKHFIWQDIPEKVSKEDASCFGAYLFHGTFLKAMKKSFETHTERVELNEKKASPPAPTTFHEFIEVYNPFYSAGMKSGPEKLKLNFWLKKWNEFDINLKIVSSIDDFINDKEKWSAIENKHLLDWGEHCAPVSLDVWNEILTREAR